MNESWEVNFGPCDGLNPQFGYQIRIERNGRVVMLTAKHPVTGADLDYAGCVDVANMYGPKRALIECTSCRAPEGAVNHVPGHVFVGWGRGWQPCPVCGGTGKHV